jgi:SAM-dependent methyltransferase
MTTQALLRDVWRKLRRRQTRRDGTAAALDDVCTVWEAQAQADPLWAVLSEPDKRGRRWDVPAFFATGEEHVAKTLARFRDLGGAPLGAELAIDFGCGVGRLTQALARRFRRAIGIDVSPTMVSVARRLNACGERAEYVLNQQVGLPFVADRSVDLVLSFITLQHLRPALAEAYLREFFRVVRPGGAVIFQIPSHLTEDFLPADRNDAPLSGRDAVADVVLVGAPPRLAAGSYASIEVDLTNASRVAWTQSLVHRLNVGNHWIDASTGQVERWDDGRAALPGLSPGQTARIRLNICAPIRPGRYRLQVAAVQEGVRWFSNRDARTAEVAVEVTACDATAGGPADAQAWTFGDVISPSYFEPPMFEMHAIPRARIEALVREHGAQLLGAEEWITEWHSFNYYVQIT